MITTTEMTYPKRPSYFAHKFVRLLSNSAAAQDIGSDGCWLLTTIVMMEDFKRYTGPVTYYNDQLMPITDFTREHTFIATRQRCIDHGWLFYRKGGNRKAGIYWVLVPEHLLPILAGITDENVSDTTELTDENVSRNSESLTKSSAYASAIPSAIPSALLSCPSPNPEERAPEQKSRKTKSALTYTEEFERFWKVYPSKNDRKVGKGSTLKEWLKLSPEDQAQVIIAATNYANRKPDQDGFLAKARDPFRFFKDDYWRDWVGDAEQAPAPTTDPKLLDELDREVELMEARKRKQQEQNA